MKALVIGALMAAFVAAPAFAAENTLDNMVKYGSSLDAGGMTFDLDYKPTSATAGSFSAGEFGGAYKIDGTKLCLTIEGLVDNQCTEYPTGKAPGDSFDIPSDQGPMKVTIRKPKA
jgi:hypothetical protein